MTPPGFDPSMALMVAQHYERHFVPAIGRPAAEGLVEAAGLGPGERVLDVACGTGIVARLAADEVGPAGRVTGLDPNPAMLAVARSAAPPDASIRWTRAPGEAIPFPDGSFDIVLCGMGLQFFSDRTAGLREMTRVLAADGRLLASLPGPTPAPLERMAEALARHVGPQSAGFVRAVFSLHDAAELRHLARDAGCTDVEVRSAPMPLRLPAPGEFLMQYLRSTPLAGVVAGLDGEALAALQRDYERDCEPFVVAGALSFPVTMTTLTATAGPG